LTSVQKSTYTTRIISFVESPEVRTQDKPSLFVYLLRNTKTRKATWQYLKKNWNAIYGVYKGGHSISTLMSGFSSFTTKKELEELKSFFKKEVYKGGERTLKQCYEEIELSIAFKIFAQKSLQTFLKDHEKSN
jgi:aminopeptidase N